MENLHIWEKVRTVPPTALKEIQAGRLKGKSDINPVWRMKVLTEQFGPCGIGWTYEITSKHLEKGAGDEIAAFVDINLYIKYDGKWSHAIPGTGGSAFVAKESKGLYVNDECYKMALTDAISVACKALGVGAGVYWDKDDTKYNGSTPPPELDKGKVQRLGILRRQKGVSEEKHKETLDKAGVSSSKYLTEEQYKKYVEWMEKRPDIQAEEPEKDQNEKQGALA